MKVGLMVGLMCAVMIACGDGERLREVEKQLSVAEEQLAAHKKTAAAAATATAGYERTAAAATATARHRYECNMKIVTVLLLLSHLGGERRSMLDTVRGMGEESAEIRRDLIEKLDDPVVTEWGDRTWPLIDKYFMEWDGRGHTWISLESLFEDLKAGRC